MEIKLISNSIAFNWKMCGWNISTGRRKNTSHELLPSERVTTEHETLTIVWELRRGAQKRVCVVIHDPETFLTTALGANSICS